MVLCARWISYCCFSVLGVMPKNVSLAGEWTIRGTAEHDQKKARIIRFYSNPDSKQSGHLIPTKNLPVYDKIVCCLWEALCTAFHKSCTLMLQLILAVPFWLCLKWIQTLFMMLSNYFPNTPSFLTSEPSMKRKACENRQLEMYTREEQ